MQLKKIMTNALLSMALITTTTTVVSAKATPKKNQWSQTVPQAIKGTWTNKFYTVKFQNKHSGFQTDNGKKNKWIGQKGQTKYKYIGHKTYQAFNDTVKNAPQLGFRYKIKVKNAKTIQVVIDNQPFGTLQKIK